MVDCGADVEQALDRIVCRPYSNSNPPRRMQFRLGAILQHSSTPAPLIEDEDEAPGEETGGTALTGSVNQAFSNPAFRSASSE